MNFVKIFILFICFCTQIFAQQVTLYRVNVEGNTTTSDKMIKYSAGLRDGTQIQRSDISTAITRLWDLGLFEDVNIVLNNESQYGVEITIKVSESPILNQVLFKGMTVREGRFREKIINGKGIFGEISAIRRGTHHAEARPTAGTGRGWAILQRPRASPKHTCRQR